MGSDSEQKCEMTLSDQEMCHLLDDSDRINFFIDRPEIKQFGEFTGDVPAYERQFMVLRTQAGCLAAISFEKQNEYRVGKCSVIECDSFIASNSSLGSNLFIENVFLKTKILDVQETNVGSFTIDNSLLSIAAVDMRNMNISNSLNINHTLLKFKNNVDASDMDRLFNENKFGHIVLSSTKIQHSLDFDTIVVKFEKEDEDKNDSHFTLDCDNMLIGGKARFVNIKSNANDELVINLHETVVDSCDMSFDKNDRVKLYLEDFKFDNIQINKKIPGYKELRSMLPSKYSKLKKTKEDTNIQECQVESGLIGFMRECQDKLILSQDGYDEANNIWRLRNKIRLYQQYGGNKLKYWTHSGWDRFTDFGLSSTTIIYVVLGVFFLYLGLNFLILHQYTSFDVQNDKLGVVGQSLIQYIPTIDFGDELRIINFEKGLPSGYKYLVIAARITGFILISILVASLGGLWKGRNK
ncbi:MAG: hypothetical protein MJZ41_11670 [Bacteroidaceae bacterium]|nr:hypothetical protein [Bacteroidaceae bacterium]